MCRNKKTHMKSIRSGVSIYKTDASSYWYARIWVSSKNKYFVRSTNEVSRIEAIEAVEEIIIKLNQDNDLSRVQETDTFSHFAELLMRQQALMSGKSRSERFASDDESIIKRHGDGLNSYFTI